MILDGLELRLLTREELRKVYHMELTATFPKSELRPLLAIERLSARGVYDVLGLFRAAEILAYAFFWRDPDCTLLDYLGVCAPLRGQGIGGAFLEAALERYRDVGGVLAEVEAPDPKVSLAENQLRERRLDFYNRAGFHQLSYEAMIFGVRYRMLAFGPVEETRVMVAHRRLYWEELLPGVRRWAVKIPYWSRSEKSVHLTV